MKHKILYHYDYQHFDTGSPKALAAMIGSLDRDIFEPVYLANGEGLLVDKLRADGVEIVSGDAVAVSVRHPFNGIARIRAHKKFLRDNDISLVHLNQFGWNTDLAMAAWMTKTPLVLHIHNPDPIHPRNLNRFAADMVLTCSEAHKSAIENFHYISDRCQVLYNQIDIRLYLEGKSIRASLGFAEDDILIATVAQVCHRKGIDILIDTARECLPNHPNLHFLVIGPDGVKEAGFAEDMKSQASQGELQGHIHFLGSRDDIPSLLASSDMFFLPTRAEPFGIVIIEAAAAGLPIVASHVGGIPEILETEDIGWTVQPVTAEAFASRIKSVLSLPDIGRSIGQNAHNSLIGRFDDDTISRQLQEYYLWLLE